MDTVSAVSLWVVGFTGLNTLQVTPLLISVFHWLPETKCQSQYPPIGRHFKRLLTTRSFPGCLWTLGMHFLGCVLFLLPNAKQTQKSVCHCSVPRNGNSWKQCPLWRWLVPSWPSKAEVGTKGSWSSNLRQCYSARAIFRNPIIAVTETTTIFPLGNRPGLLFQGLRFNKWSAIKSYLGSNLTSATYCLRGHGKPLSFSDVPFSHG